MRAPFGHAVALRPRLTPYLHMYLDYYDTSYVEPGVGISPPRRDPACHYTRYDDMI